jgi:hypothetical protein
MSTLDTAEASECGTYITRLAPTILAKCVWINLPLYDATTTPPGMQIRVTPRGEPKTAHILVSYSQEDRDEVRLLASFLKAAGYSVW